MATIERKPYENCRTLLEDADRSCEQDQYIDVNLAASSERDKKTVGRGRRPQKSSDSQEFEFNLDLAFASNSLESTQVALAPADELFYQGQLLPLERDSRVHPVFSEQGQLESDVTASCLVFSSRDQDMRCNSCRMDALALDPSLVDFPCSSFRSQSSDHWESSGNKGTGDSSSSRDSNGSSQNSCFSGDKEVLGHCAQSAKSSSGQSRLGPAGALNLKSFFGGLKKVFRGELSSNEIVCSADLSRPGPSSSSSRRCAEDLYGDEAGKDLLKRVSSSKPKASSAMDAKQVEREIRVSKVEFGSAFSGSKPSAGRIEGEKQRSVWQRYTRKLKPLYKKMLQRQGGGGLLSAHQLRQEDCEKTCAMASSNRLEGRFSQASLWPGDNRENLSCSSSRFLAIASCPPSVRSSPNNSGVLAVITKSPGSRPPTFNSVSNMSMSASASTMQELHSAVQGAIAHCKESISGTPAPLVSPSAAVP